jgi:hypothetical protein
MSEHAAHCGNCGATLTPGVKFCEVCGQPVRPAVCGQCGTPLAPEVRFCEVCGSPVGAQPPAARPQVQPAAVASGWAESPPQQAEQPAPAWTPAPAYEAPGRKRRRWWKGCLWILFLLALLVIGAAVAAYLTGWLRIVW